MGPAWSLLRLTLLQGCSPTLGENCRPDTPIDASPPDPGLREASRALHMKTTELAADHSDAGKD